MTNTKGKQKSLLVFLVSKFILTEPNKCFKSSFWQLCDDWSGLDRFLGRKTFCRHDSSSNEVGPLSFRTMILFLLSSACWKFAKSCADVQNDSWPTVSALAKAKDVLATFQGRSISPLISPNILRPLGSIRYRGGDTTLFKILEEGEKENRMILYPKQFAEEESEIGKVDSPRKVIQK